MSVIVSQMAVFVIKVKQHMFYCTVHLDNIRFPFYQQMHPLLII